MAVGINMRSLGLEGPHNLVPLYLSCLTSLHKTCLTLLSLVCHTTQHRITQLSPEWPCAFLFCAFTHHLPWLPFTCQNLPHLSGPVQTSPSRAFPVSSSLPQYLVNVYVCPSLNNTIPRGWDYTLPCIPQCLGFEPIFPTLLQFQPNCLGFLNSVSLLVNGVN